MDIVVGDDGRAYALVQNLQTCIYGRVKHAIEVVRNAGAAEGGTQGLWGSLRGASSAPRALWKATGAQVAIKCIERRRYEAHVRQHTSADGSVQLNEDPIKEVAVMQYIAASGGAQHVLSLTACYATEETVYVVLPYCPHGDLFGIVERHGGLAERAAFVYMEQTVTGLERLHAMGLMHHDMSLENMMLDADRCAVVIDFGMAVKTRPRYAAAGNASSARSPHQSPNYRAVPLRPSNGWPCRCGKRLYMAPELYGEGDTQPPRQSFDAFAADVWACGIILFLLLTGMPPWDANTGPSPRDARYCYVRDGRLADLLRNWNINLSQHAPDLLQKLLTADPRRRITLPELRQHPWWRAMTAQR